VRADLQFDQRIAGLPAPDARPALALQTQHLALDHARGHVDVQRLALGQQDPLLDPVHRLEEIDFEMVAVVHAAHVEAATGGAAEHVAENITELAEIIRRLIAAGTSVAIVAPRRLTAAPVDFTGIVPLALVGIAEDVERCGDALEFFLGRRIPRIAVRMILLRELAISAANFVMCRCPANA
jgi:hypothetical protein